MKNLRAKKGILVALVLGVTLVSCSDDDKEIQTVASSEHTASEAQNLKNFDRLDFEGWSLPNFGIFDSYHSENIKVIDVDGTETNFSQHHDFAVGFQSQMHSTIYEHPVKLADGEWTAVSGILEIPLSNGTKIRSRMLTLSKWKDGKMVEEQLFYDKQ